MVNVVFGHGHLRSVENRRFAHIVPHPGVTHCALELVELEHSLPPLNCLGVEAINPVGSSRPAPSFIWLFLLVMDGKVLGKHFFRGDVVVGLLDMGVKKDNKLTAVGIQMLTHVNRVRERVRFPDDIVWDFVLVHVAINVSNIIAGDIVPSALVVTNGKLLRHRSVAGQLSVGLGEVGRSGAEEYEDVEETTLGNPMSMGACLATSTETKRVCAALVLGDIDPSLGNVEPENTDRRTLAMSLHERNSTVECHRAVEDVLKHIGVVHAVGLGVVAISTTSLLQ
ncbi:hypothetical protein HG531_006546 [Fusarium graminearum]|nr:hypothetical protein HG531_006546 [Fusarium graminearum]